MLSTRQFPFAALLGLAACVTNPYTGRSQLLLMSENWEIQTGLAAYPQLTAKHKVVTTGADAATVERVMRRLIPHAKRDYAWEVKLLDAPKQVNAWALPGGKMAVYTGILPILKTEDGIAAVMGHEIGHALAHHSNERASQQLLVGLGLTVADLSVKGSHRDEILAALGVGLEVGVLLPYSRSQESEADEIGLRLMIDAGYDPWEAVGVWERMAARGGTRGPSFLSTHPAPEDRAARLRALIPKLQRR